MFHVV